MKDRQTQLQQQELEMARVAANFAEATLAATIARKNAEQAESACALEEARAEAEDARNENAQTARLLEEERAESARVKFLLEELKQVSGVSSD